MSEEIINKSWIDLGNLFIGIGTIFLGFIVLFVNTRNSKLDRKVQIANKRQEWINNLRKNVAIFLGEIEIISETSNNPLNKVSNNNLQTLFRSMNEISMLVHPEDEDSSKLIELMAQTLTRAKNGDQKYAEYAPQVVIYGKILMDKEWKKIKQLKN
ncbi:hypothetical protein [uncultured Aquimarina sp.]|uniref:hypothetical protein n=1 Tax=uncultured Aquimarina sp. TaxID=575652 RepID=UPI002634D03E|nr:hypothetical protein [uncultured Aquimarina sp.]